MKWQKTALFFLVSIAAINHVLASSNTEKNKTLKLQDYEPNTVSYRKDENDETHLDFVVSQMYPILHDGREGEESDQSDWLLHPYASFTGQFGFYAFGNRESRPVIGKRYNPKLFARHWIGNTGSYLDVGYAHESNGQSINTEAQYLQKVSEIRSRNERTSFADDYLSRGWDYINVIYKDKDEDRLASSIYLNFKYFLNDSPIQGTPEEYYSWETLEGKKRKEVDGISVIIKHLAYNAERNSRFKTALLYTTGYEDVFKNNTIRIELTYQMREWPPVFFWVSEGYNSSLTDYYKRITSFGFGFEFRNFNDDF